MLYEVLLPFLTGDSLDRTIATWEAAAAAQGLAPLPFRTPRRCIDFILATRSRRGC